jgi:hypothetical protein
VFIRGEKKRKQDKTKDEMYWKKEDCAEADRFYDNSDGISAIFFRMYESEKNRNAAGNQTGN